MTRSRLETTNCKILWDEGVEAPEIRTLTGRQNADVVIVGAGFSGLWTAHWLTEFSPETKVAVVEAERVGHGASGRNGGWLSALLPVSLTELSRTLGTERTVDLQSIMFSAVGEVVEFCRRHQVEADVSHAGSISLIRNRAQEIRAHSEIEDYRRFGFDSHVRFLDRRRTSEHVLVDHESLYRPDCAAVHPRRLMEGLATIVRSRGVDVYEGSRVESLRPGVVDTRRGSIVAPAVIDAREAYGSRTSRRSLVPIHSSMIATRPLPQSIWDRIGLAKRETLSDHRRQIVYAQRTADDRLAFGGRGVRYAFGSRIRNGADFDDRVHRQLVESMVELFPVLEDVDVTHRWGGPLGVPRDWTWTVNFDRPTGLGRLGGYVGDGVTSTYVAGRAMARLVLDGTDTLPLVGHRSRRWEPEPLRWIGINAMNVLAASADRTERSGRTGGPVSRLLDRVLG